MRFFIFTLGLVFFFAPVSGAEPAGTDGRAYTVGVDDMLDISVLQPENISTTVAVAPDGSITFPFVGSIRAAGLSLPEIQEALQRGLADGYMKYPVVAVTLRECRSRKFFVYGEVMHPGPYPLEDHTTVLRAVAIAGGFTKFGSAGVRVLRPRAQKTGYDAIKVNIRAIMDGAANKDVLLEPGDIVAVSERMF